MAGVSPASRPKAAVARSSEQHEVVAVDDFEAFARGVEGGDGCALLLGDGGDFLGGEGRLAAGEHGAVGSGDVDDITGGEFAG